MMTLGTNELPNSICAEIGKKNFKDKKLNKNLTPK